MGFLSGLLLPLIEWAAEKLVTWGIKEAKGSVADKALDAQGVLDAKKLSDATLLKDQDAALKNSIDHSFPKS